MGRRYWLLVAVVLLWCAGSLWPPGIDVYAFAAVPFLELARMIVALALGALGTVAGMIVVVSLRRLALVQMGRRLSPVALRRRMPAGATAGAPPRFESRKDPGKSPRQG